VIRVDLARDRVRDGPGTDGRIWAGYRGGMTATHPASVLQNAGTDGSERAGRPGSTGEVAGYRVLASDGEAGHAEDFAVDAEGWRIRDVVVGARGRYSAERVLLDPASIERIAPEPGTVHVGLTGEQIWGRGDTRATRCATRGGSV
jgi:hypothetical protein